MGCGDRGARHVEERGCKERDDMGKDGRYWAAGDIGGGDRGGMI